MAEVFSAESAGLEGFKKRVAIKRVLPHLAEKAEFIGMFLDEARLSAHLGHSNCVQVFDIGQGDNTYFIVMEMVDGSDLKGVIKYYRDRQQVIPLEEALLICVRICEGLAYAHELRDSNGTPLNIVHRDMSPPNVLMTRYGEVKIADFGLAKANSQLEESQPGIIKGKFGYLSPEAAQGQVVDRRADIFAVGIILWEMLAGRRLFQGKSDLETVKQVQRAQVPDITTINSGVPRSVAAVLARSLSADPETRYQAARHLGDDLNKVLFQLPRPVSSFDLAALVGEVVGTRDSVRARRVARGSDRIGSMIQQTLFQFTSLDAGKAATPQPGGFDARSFSGTLPIETGQDEPMDWGDSLGLNMSPTAPPAEVVELEVGNLSALEEDRRASHPELLAGTAPVEIPTVAPVPRDVLRARRAKKNTAMLPLIVLVLVAAAAAGYFLKAF